MVCDHDSELDTFLDDEAKPDLTYRRATNHMDAIAMSHIMAEAFGIPRDSALFVGLTSWTANNGYAIIGSAGGIDVSTAAVTQSGEWLYILNVATLPAFQGRGYGSRTTTHAMREGTRHTGLSRYLLHSTAAGDPVYERIGFEKTGQIMLLELKG
jgi:ribosomal protein S18 acetylase RimI-like enzyme